jgi:hypothetical protein
MSSYFRILLITLVGQMCSSPPSNIRHVKILCVDLEITTIARIHCEEFEKSFGESVKILEYNSPEEWNELIQEIERFIKSAEQTRSTVDVRMRIEVTHANNKLIQTYCIGYNILSVDGVNYIMNDQLRDYLLTKVCH